MASLSKSALLALAEELNAAVAAGESSRVREALELAPCSLAHRALVLVSLHHARAAVGYAQKLVPLVDGLNAGLAGLSSFPACLLLRGALGDAFLQTAVLRINEAGHEDPAPTGAALASRYAAAVRGAVAALASPVPAAATAAPPLLEPEKDNLGLRYKPVADWAQSLQALADKYGRVAAVCAPLSSPSRLAPGSYTVRVAKRQLSLALRSFSICR